MSGSRPKDPRIQLASELNLGDVLSSFEAVIKGEMDADELVNSDQIKKAINSKSGNSIKYLGGDNNKNYIIKNSDDSASLVLQLSTCKDTSLEAVNLLSKSEPSYLAKCFQFSQAFPASNATSGLSEEDQLPRVVRVVELCDSNLENKTKEMQPQDRVIFAAELTGKCSHMLGDLSKNRVLWTDFKPGNVLLDTEGNIKVPDTKAFIKVDDLVEKNNKVEFEDVTKSLCSRAFIDADYDGIPYKDSQKVMESEYSYQLAVLLHNVATGELKRNYENSSNRNNKNNRDMTFDYDKFPEVYSTPNGRELRTVIERLSNNNPSLRMPHQAAAQYLNMKVLKSNNAIAASSPLAAHAAKVTDPMTSKSVSESSSSASVSQTKSGSNNRSSDNTPQRIANAAKKEFPRHAIVRSAPDKPDKPTPPRLGGS